MMINRNNHYLCGAGNQFFNKLFFGLTLNGGVVPAIFLSACLNYPSRSSYCI